MLFLEMSGCGWLRASSSGRQVSEPTSRMVSDRWRAVNSRHYVKYSKVRRLVLESGQQQYERMSDCFLFQPQMDRTNQPFMKNVTEFNFGVCSRDWQITSSCLNSPAVTSAHLAPCAAQNKHSLLQIVSDPPTPAGVGCISAADGSKRLFQSNCSLSDPCGSNKLFGSDLICLGSGCKQDIVLFQCLCFIYLVLFVP